MGFLQEINPFSNVKTAVKRASRETGVDFGYLMKTAARESSLDPKAKAPTSSASGLFQFIEQTWLKTLKEDGPALGLGDQAAKISRTPDGRFVISDKTVRQEILNLRSDPTASAMMAGALTRRNHEMLEQGLGRKPTEGELYMAHFMGGNGALRFIQVAANKPDANAADYFPREARANRAIFFDTKGAPRSAGDVYQLLASKHDTQPVEMEAGRVRDAAGFALAAQENATPPSQQEPQPFATSHHADAPMFHGLFGSRSLMSDQANARDFVSVWGSARQLAAMPENMPETAQAPKPDEPAAQAGAAILAEAPVPARRPYFRPETTLATNSPVVDEREVAAASDAAGPLTMAVNAAQSAEARFGAIGAPLDLAALTPGAWLRREEGKA